MSGRAQKLMWWLIWLAGGASGAFAQSTWDVLVLDDDNEANPIAAFDVSVDANDVPDAIEIGATLPLTTAGTVTVSNDLTVDSGGSFSLSGGGSHTVNVGTPSDGAVWLSTDGNGLGEWSTTATDLDLGFIDGRPVVGHASGGITGLSPVVADGVMYMDENYEGAAEAQFRYDNTYNGIIMDAAGSLTDSRFAGVIPTNLYMRDSATTGLQWPLLVENRADGTTHVPRALVMNRTAASGGAALNNMYLPGILQTAQDGSANIYTAFELLTRLAATPTGASGVVDAEVDLKVGGIPIVTLDSANTRANFTTNTIKATGTGNNHLELGNWSFRQASGAQYVVERTASGNWYLQLSNPGAGVGILSADEISGPISASPVTVKPHTSQTGSPRILLDSGTGGGGGTTGQYVVKVENDGTALGGWLPGGLVVRHDSAVDADTTVAAQVANNGTADAYYQWVDDTTAAAQLWFDQSADTLVGDDGAGGEWMYVDLSNNYVGMARSTKPTNPFEAGNGGTAAHFRIDTGGNFGAGNVAPSDAQFHIKANSATEKVVRIQTSSTSPSDYLVFGELSDNTEVFHIGNDSVNFEDLSFARRAQSVTVATGAVTATGSRLIVTGQTSPDDLDTITASGSLTTYSEIVVAPVNSADDVVLKDGTGNLSLNGDFTMDHADDRITLEYDGTNWVELSRSDNGA